MWITCRRQFFILSTFKRTICWQRSFTQLFTRCICQNGVFFCNLILSISSSHSKICDVRGARYITDFDGRYIFYTIFHEDTKNIISSRLDTPNRRPSSAQSGCSSKLSRQAGQSLGVNWVCPILKKIIFLESS